MSRSALYLPVFEAGFRLDWQNCGYKIVFGGMYMNNRIREFALVFGMLWSVGVLAAILVSPGQADIAETKYETTVTSAGSEGDIVVLVAGEKQQMSFSEYLTGVLLCEIPADFHPEAKKAQAIVARTYAARVAEIGIKHGPGVVCGDPGCCQGYISPEEYLGKWGVDAPIASARDAVEETEGVVVTYKGKLVDATYFSCSGGQTEDALAVWGSDVPYLRSVESPGEEDAEHYWYTVKYTPQKFCEVLGIALSGKPASWFGGISYTKGGGVAQMFIGGKAYTGTHLRSALGLRSTWFSVKANENEIEITTRGFGHRVGMSQYGADAMAVGGSTCDEILHHYYYGVEIGRLSELE